MNKRTIWADDNGFIYGIGGEAEKKKEEEKPKRFTFEGGKRGSEFRFKSSS